jgi:cell division protein FtsB
MPLSSEIPSYKDFLKNPIVGLLFMCLLAIGYLYIDNRNTLTQQIEDLKEEVKELKAENAILYAKIIEISKKVK